MTGTMSAAQVRYAAALAAHRVASEQYARAAMALPKLGIDATAEELAALEAAEDQLIAASGINATDDELSAARRGLWEWGRGVALLLASPMQADEINNLFDKGMRYPNIAPRVTDVCMRLRQ